MKRLLGALVVIAGVAWPFAVYAGAGRWSPRAFAAALGALWLLRLLSGARQPGQRALAAAGLAFCAVLAAADSAALLQWYPVLLSALLLALFAGSLYRGMPVVERLARLTEPELPPAAVAYTRRVTAVWAGFFLFNGSLCAALALWAPLAWWTLYTGLIAYLLMGLLFAGEWLVRRRVRRRHAPPPAPAEQECATA